jgi:uncharacterized protein with PIN domain
MKLRSIILREQELNKCVECKKVFGKVYPLKHNPFVRFKVQQCDEFAWCWSCDEIIWNNQDKEEARE